MSFLRQYNINCSKGVIWHPAGLDLLAVLDFSDEPGDWASLAVQIITVYT